MEVRLLVSKWCPVCPQAEQVWAAVAHAGALDYQVIDVADPPGRALVSRLRIKTVPAVVIDGRLQAVGLQSVAEATRLVAGGVATD